MSKDVYEQMVDACLMTGIPLISMDTAARLMAIIHTYGNNEALVYSPNLRADVRYTQQKYGIDGGQTPNMDFVRLFQQYARELEKYEEKENSDEENPKPKWVMEFVYKRYGIKNIN